MKNCGGGHNGDKWQPETNWKKGKTFFFSNYNFIYPDETR